MHYPIKYQGSTQKCPLTAAFLQFLIHQFLGLLLTANNFLSCKEKFIYNYEGRTESHEQLFFVCELGTVDEGECGGRWNQLLCYP